MTLNELHNAKHLRRVDDVDILISLKNEILVEMKRLKDDLHSAFPVTSHPEFRSIQTTCAKYKAYLDLIDEKLIKLNPNRLSKRESKKFIEFFVENYREYFVEVLNDYKNQTI